MKREPQMMKIAVTGSGGQLGAELCRMLGDRAVGLDLPDFDLTNRELVLDTISGMRPEAIVKVAVDPLCGNVSRPFMDRCRSNQSLNLPARGRQSPN